jgi:ribosome-binding protein aMBF1 (putative translation factor)
MSANQRRKPRVFKWSQAARDAVRNNLGATGSELRKVITELAEDSGNPRDACLRFARQLGMNTKQSYRPWSLKEQQVLEHELEFSSVKTVALKLRRSRAQVYAMMHRMGISAKDNKESLSMYALARLLKKRPQIVRKWIESGELKAQNEGTQKLPRFMIFQEDLRKFVKEHRELITANRVDRERLKFIFEYVFPRSHEDLLRVRESKKEREAYEEQMQNEPLDADCGDPGYEEIIAAVGLQCSAPIEPDRQKPRHFIRGYVFPASDESVLRTRESKKEQATYEEQMEGQSII